MSPSMPPENRFAEVTRKSREARARLNANQRLNGNTTDAAKASRL